jgi:NADPH-dependent 2,4-dienoyl-CoA reductase/sulfur reductase-like enzyme
VAAGPFVVVGGSLAGLRAIEAARRGGYDGRIVLVGAERHLPYDRPPLSKAFLDDGAEARFLCEPGHLGDLGVELRLGEPATRLDPGVRTVQVGADGVRYGTLLIATGSAPRVLPHGAGLPGVVTLRTLDDALTIRRFLLRGARLVVVGCGFIGSEVASSARRLGNPVTIIEAAATPLARAVGARLGPALSALHQRNGTRLRLGVHVTGVRGSGQVEAVELSDGSVLAADLVVVGIGSAPATAWLAGSGVRLSEADRGVVCDEFLATTVPGVFAAGDVAHWPNRLMDVPLMRMENWTGAAEQGAAAARNALRLGPPAPFQTVPYVWSDWYDSRIQIVGRPSDQEVRVVSGDLAGPRFVAIHRDGDRIVGAVTLGEPGKVMKYRRLIAGRGSWQAALDLYAAPAA